ncbi:ABC transporter substrate-binding protein [Desulfopila sp. IMCC35006]|uniref:ABC transporter substrate-binding protein n=1 Tax=Desulfopila sp. IMCC35006 TaxID=2569542 RepID=UPI0010AC309D|nr:ABC transporter substrate-binding protein [Desulfopila sp. IMCC35006]TKB28500.1 ABC transporter substrate-binding protein [Desulfopila sp. IMCC35006]
MKKLLTAALLCACLFLQGITVYGATISVSQFVEHPALDAVLQGFQDYLHEKNIPVKYTVHNAQANMGTATQIAQQMVGEKADLLVAIATPSAQTCVQALSKAPAELKRPLLFTAVTDPIAAGLVKDLQHPDAGITGVSDLLPVKEHIMMVLTFKPDIKKLGLLYNAGEANSKATIASIKALRGELGFDTVEATASKTADVYQAAKSLVGKVDAIFIPTDNTIISALESVLKVGVQNKLPIFAADVDSVKRGAVAAMGFDYYKHGYQTGAIAERILNGEKPENIPVQFQTDLQLYINADYARQMGVVPPEALLKKATKIYQ